MHKSWCPTCTLEREAGPKGFITETWSDPWDPYQFNMDGSLGFSESELQLLFNRTRKLAQ